MNIKDLENFCQVSQYKSFSFAAKMMGVSQPTLSESIKRLETQIDSSLFYRSKTGIELTPSGEMILLKATDLLNLKYQIDSISSHSKLVNQNFKLGCHATVGGYFLKDFLISIHKKYSNISFTIEHDHSQNIQDLIQEGKIDFGIVVNPKQNPDLIIKKLCDDKICIWESTKKVLRNNQIIADTQLIQIQSILRKWKEAPSRCISTSDFHIIGEMAESGLGMAILPERFVLQKKLQLKRINPSLFFKDIFSVVYRPEFGKNKIEKDILESIYKLF